MGTLHPQVRAHRFATIGKLIEDEATSGDLDAIDLLLIGEALDRINRIHNRILTRKPTA